MCVTLGHEYLGGIEYERFLNERRISKADFSFLVREPGFPEWNLGFARNYALLKAHSIGLDRVLFMDDDIQVPAISLIDEFFQRVGSTSFVGAKVDGAVDLSLLGHIAAEAGMTNPEMLSGGFLAFNPATVTEHFVNVYNEDWIWLLLQVNRQNFTQHGSVIQDYTDPFDGFQSKVLFQEHGELLVDGLLDVYETDSYDRLRDVDFWKRVLVERANYLEELFNQCLAHQHTKGIEILNYLAEKKPSIRAEELVLQFTTYIHDVEAFRTLFASMREPLSTPKST